jgi:hypothetical protein
LITIGIIASILGGIGQPIIALLFGRLMNVLLASSQKNETSTSMDQLSHDGYVYVGIMFGVGVAMLIASFTQVVND